MNPPASTDQHRAPSSGEAPAGRKRGSTKDPAPKAPALKEPAIPASALTPAMQQYLEQKAQVGDAILLFRMGDFYETFYDDAKTIARVLGLTLTSRNKSSDEPIPLAGVPYHAADGYIARLVRAGYKVAISEQIEDPKLAKTVVRRAVQRIITPGTLTDEALLEERSPNYLVALCFVESAADGAAGAVPSGLRRQASPPASRKAPRRAQVGLACVELAGGRFFAEMVDAAALADELARLRPAEVLMPEAGIDAEPPNVGELRESLGDVFSMRPAHVFDPHLARQALCRHFGVHDLTGFGFDAFDASLSAAAAVLDYLQETQKTALAHINRILPRRSGDGVMIDAVTLRSLEIERTMRDGARQGSLLDAIDLTESPMGARRLREWVCFPLQSVPRIFARQSAIAGLLGQPDRLRRIREQLRRMSDVERIIARLGVGRASPRDLVSLGNALLSCARVAEAIGPAVGARADSSDLLTGLAAALVGLDSIGAYLTAALKPDAPPIVRDGGFIADGHDAELDRLRRIGSEGREWLAEYQARESARTGIPNLKVGYNSVFGYYIEITHQHRGKVPPEYVRKQTVRNAERYITEELKHHEHEVLAAADRAIQLEIELFEAIRRRTLSDLDKLKAAAEALGDLDAVAGLAELARTRDYCRPELVAPEEADTAAVAGAKTPAHSQVLDIVDGRHPVLDIALAERFVPNDCKLSGDADRLLVITGPNMAGKSTYIRQVALLVLLAQTGSFVPARSMRWSPVDRIFARVGASDELARGHSTFMVEMVETARILHNATPRSLVILDEIGRGTSTYDGLSLAWAITEYVAEGIGCRTLFATHYHELTELAGQLPGVANYNVAVREQLRPDGAGRNVVFLHKIVPGPTDRSYGVHVAAMAGLPASIVKRGESILKRLERGFHGGSRPGRPSRRGSAGSDQLLLFGEPEGLPEWWREVVDTLGALDANETTPMEALSTLKRLKDLVQNRTDGDEQQRSLERSAESG